MPESGIASLPLSLGKLVREFQQSRRLQLGLAAVLLLVGVEGCLRWIDHLAARERQLQEVRSELGTLRTQSGDESALRQSLADLVRAREAVDARLWAVSSEAVGQARLKDWVSGIINRVRAQNYTLAVSTARPVGGNAEAGDLREIRATTSMTFTPAVLEMVLGEIEGGEAFANVEALNVDQRQRRVELTLRVLMRINRKGTAAVAMPTAAGPAAAITGSKP
jgi:hypothetical protein